MENKKKYDSTKIYSQKYNKENLNVQLNRELLLKLKEKLKGKSMKEYIENLILESFIC